MNTETSPWRRWGARAPLVAALVGTTVALGSVVLFFTGNDVRLILGVTAGLLCVLPAVWYAANPFVKEERAYPDLRREVDGLINLVKELHNAALRGDTDAVESIKERMPPQVEVVVSAASRSAARPNR